MTSTLASKPLARLSGHTGPIHALTYSSGNGQYLLSGSSDRSVKLWNPAKAGSAHNASPALIQSYTGAHIYEVLSIAVAADNARFVSGGGDKSVFLWDVSSAKTLRRLGGAVGGHTGRIESVKFGGEDDSVVVSGSYDASVRLWDLKAGGGKPLMVLSEGRDSITDVNVNGHEIGASCVDGKVRWYDLRMGLCIVDVVGSPVTSLTSTTQGDSMLVSTLDSTLRLLDKTDGKLLQSYKHDDYLNTTYRIRSTLAANDALVVAGSEDGYVCAWDVLTGNMVARVRHNAADQAADVKSSRKTVSSLACHKRSGEWASAGGDGTIVVWGSDSR